MQEENEIFLTLASNDTRDAVNSVSLVLEPKESITKQLQFQKFYDNHNEATSLTFGAVRVMEQYSGTKDVAEEIIQSEIQNAIAKFSVNLPINQNH